jgi:hypothetical protein
VTAALLSVLVLLVIAGFYALFAAIHKDDVRHAAYVHDLGVATPPHPQGRPEDFDHLGRPW